MEQRLYTEEGISWSHIEWILGLFGLRSATFPRQDNREIIDQLEKKPWPGCKRGWSNKIDLGGSKPHGIAGRRPDFP